MFLVPGFASGEEMGLPQLAEQKCILRAGIDFFLEELNGLFRRIHSHFGGIGIIGRRFERLRGLSRQGLRRQANEDSQHPRNDEA
jgi:hypothetical protein